MIRKTLGLLLWAMPATGIALTPAAAADKVKLKMAEVVRSQFYVPMSRCRRASSRTRGSRSSSLPPMAATARARCCSPAKTEFALAGPEVPIYIYNGKSPDKPVILSALTATDGLFLASRQKLDKFDWSMLNGKKIMG